MTTERARTERARQRQRQAAIVASFVRFVSFRSVFVVVGRRRGVAFVAWSLGRLGEWVASALIVNAAAAAVSPLQRSDRGQHRQHN